MISSLSFRISALLVLSCVVDKSFGVPIPANDGNGNATLPPGAQPFPFREDIGHADEYVVVDDMVIRKDPTRAGLVEGTWPNGVVPYTFAYTIAPNQRSEILQAMKELAEVSCIKFRPATREDTYNLEFKNDPMTQGCSSYVGWQNRKNQPVQLSTICSKGNAIHEVLHALGFFHEQTRNDRDEYVTINFQNIQRGFENNFKKDSELYVGAETDYFGVPYNYDSIMHYGKTYFSKNGQNTIDVKEISDEQAAPMGSPDNLGQRDFISEGDITMLRTKYNCDAAEEAEPLTESPEAVEENTEQPEAETTVAATAKPTTKNPVCNYNPNLPVCKQ